MMTESAQCCVIGGGPAGMMAGVLLARQGVKVIVVEKHPDFLRDFRGDTIHPSTLELMHELGWADEFLNLPHNRMSDVTVSMGGSAVTFADFRKLKVHYPFIAFVPQWDFLDFLADKAFDAAQLPADAKHRDDRSDRRQWPGDRHSRHRRRRRHRDPGGLRSRR